MRKEAPMVKGFTVVVLLALVFGCSATRKIEVPNANVTVIDYGATRRGAYLFCSAEGGSVLVSEPSPDIAKDIASSLGLSADTIGDLAKPELKAEYAAKVVDLASRSQTLQVLRESLFRLSEMGAGYELSVEQRVWLFSKVLDTVRLIAATEFANSEASEEVKAEALKRFLEDTETGTVKIPGTSP
jgi:hypothetical protein